MFETDAKTSAMPIPASTNGMLCNVAAALDIPEIAWDENWARERLDALGEGASGSSGQGSAKAVAIVDP